MHSVFSVLTKPILVRSIGRPLLLLLITIGLSFPVLAEDAKSLSPSVVLVLKLVSKTHVKPTTGIVISDDGLVLVPAGVMREEGEIVVLDNGVDIAVNGRPAELVDTPTSGGLALLSVKGLKRPGIVLSANSLESDQLLHLETFPPAKFMAEGADPLWEPVSLSQQNSNMRVAVSSETPLPFVTGPIIDDCGYLAGLSLALGPPSMDRDKLSVVVFTDELTQIFDAMQVSLPSARCGNTKPIVTADIENEVAVAVTDEPAAQQFEPESATGNSANVDQAPAEPSTGVSQPESPTSTTTPSLWQIVPVWLLALTAVVLAVLIWKGLFFLQLLRAPSQTKNGNKLSAADEPDTTKLGMGSDTRPRSAPLVESRPPDMSSLPDGCNAVVIVEANLDSDTKFRRYCVVNNESIDILIGRGDADVNLEHPSISRRHARLMSANGLLTFSDTGSSNGTWINGTPCLPTEVMFIEIDDEILLGQVQLRFKIATNQTELT